MDLLCLYAESPPPIAPPAAAAALETALVADLVHVTRQVAGVQVELWLPPDADPAALVGSVPPGWTCRVQQGADHGARLAWIFRTGLAQAGRRVVVASTLGVTFTPPLLQTALAVLAQVPVVVQTAHDGGFVLVGQSTPCAEMFADVPWGTAAVMPTIWQRLQAARVRHCELPPTFALRSVTDFARLAAAITPATHPALHAWWCAWREALSPKSCGPATP